jgi:hypothetical protein
MAKRKTKGLKGTREEHQEEFRRALGRSLDLLEEAEQGEPCRGGTEKLAESMRWLGVAQSNLFFAPPSESASAKWGLTRVTQQRITNALLDELGAGCVRHERRRPGSSGFSPPGDVTGEMAAFGGLARPRRAR